MYKRETIGIGNDVFFLFFFWGGGTAPLVPPLATALESEGTHSERKGNAVTRLNSADLLLLIVKPKPETKQLPE